MIKNERYSVLMRKSKSEKEVHPVDIFIGCFFLWKKKKKCYIINIVFLKNIYDRQL